MASAPKITVNFFERDLGLKRILAEAAKLRKKPFVKVGVTQAKGSKVRTDGKKTTAEIAQIHEYGAPDANIPERSFIRSTVSRNQEKYNAHKQVLAGMIFDANATMTVERALGLIGQEVASDIRATIRAKLPPPLKEDTIRRKNAGKLKEAKGTIESLRSKGDLTRGERGRLLKAGNLVMTGGESTPLIDSAQLINSISYAVVPEGEGSAEYEGEGPSTY